MHTIGTTGWAKNGTIFVGLITSLNINRFSKICSLSEPGDNLQ